MKKSPLDSKSKVKPASTQPQALELPRGVEPTRDRMATMLSHPTAPYATTPSPYDFGPQLPPLVPAAARHFVPTDPFSYPPESPNTSLSHSTSWTHHKELHLGNRPTFIGDNHTSLGQPGGSSGEQSHIDGSAVPPRGAKRRLGAQTSKSIQHVNTLTSASSSMLEGRSGPSNATMPMTAPNTAIPSVPSTASAAAAGFPNTSAYSRIKLHLRQHPRAARAGPDGKDRRTVDPPPVLQLLIDDFDLEKDMRFLKAHDWVVHTKLVSAQEPREDMTTVASQSDSGNSNDKRLTRLLLGTTVSSPFFCSDDPDPENAPRHPQNRPSPPPSPTTRFIKTSSRQAEKARDPEAYKTFPGAFFIFADLSVRKAGQYRLEFRLMKMDPSVLVPGSIVPTLSIAVSDVFNVVNAKDFDQVQPSTNLVRGLLDRGAGFPLKLKKGLREGQRRRPRAEDSDEDEDADTQDEDEIG